MRKSCFVNLANAEEISTQLLHFKGMLSSYFLHGN